MDMTAVLDQFRSLGLMVEQLEPDGKIHRVPVSYPRADKGQKKSGWYVVHEFRLQSGAIGLAGVYGNHKLPDTPPQKVGLPTQSLTESDRREYEERRKAAAEAAERDRAEAAEACAARAQSIWSKLPDSGKSAYLDNKGVRAFGLRFSRGSVVVPLYRPEPDVSGGFRLVGLQFIDSDGNKKFLTGTPKQGAYHWISVDDALDDSPVVVVEGYATGASVCMATGWRVAVAFDAGNLKPVALELRRIFPDTPILVAGDNDVQTKGNPGLTKAKAAAQAVNGHWVVPSFGGADVAD